MMDKEQFYPTPEDLARELFQMADLRYTNTILEPSAGTGSLLEAFKKVNRYNDHYSFHCIEANKERQATLQGKDFPVIWDDFLTFAPLTPYQAILMNPPFSQGAKHLLKALQICAPGGQILCILNAETIKNPCTKERMALLAELEAQDEFEVTFREQAFSDAERPSMVEVALIYVKKKAVSDRCVTFEHFKRRTERKQTEEPEETSITRYGEIPQLIDHYKAEVKTALALYDEMLHFERISLKGMDNYEKGVLTVEVNAVKGSNYFDTRINIVKKISYKYWKILLYSKELSSLLTGSVQNSYAEKLVEMADFEFNERNILQMKHDLSRNLLQNIDDAIMNVWDTFTSRYAYTDYSKNIHYYTGWKTNNAFAVNKKVIIPLYAFDSWSGKFNPSYRVTSELSDIEKVMNFLDCGRTEAADMCYRMKEAEQTGENRNIDTKYFTVTLYKKGTCHLVFKDMELLKKFNLYAGRKKAWLPDDYGRKPYSHLSEEERAVVDSFEGAKSYEDTYRNQAFYLPQNSDLLRLNPGNAA